MASSLKKFLKKKIPLHFSLIDPEKCATEEKRESSLEILKDLQTDAVLIGGSSSLNVDSLFKLYEKFTELKTPKVSFLRDASEVCSFADGAFAPLVINSRKEWFRNDNFYNCINSIKEVDTELITLAYIVQKSKTSVSFIVDPVSIYPRSSILNRYARVINALNFNFAYLEGGSGAEKVVEIELIKGLKRRLKVPLLVGGGITNTNQVNEALKAGADGIVTGTLLEVGEIDRVKEIIKAVKKFK